MKKLLVCTFVAVVAALTWNMSSASAHHPDVVATNVCTDGVPTIEVTASAWTELPPGWGQDHRQNNNVRIDVTGPGVNLTTSGAFTPPSYSVTTQFAVPQAVGQTLTVRVTSVAPWGPNGEYGSAGEFRETTVTVAPPCDEGTTTTAAPTTTSAAPTTTVGPGAGGTTSVPPAPTTAPPSGGSGSGNAGGGTEVGGITEVRPQVPAPSGDAAAQLAFTGTESTTLVLAGIGLLAAGLGLVIGVRRREA
jgi:LPXTG-motif cell wall-anchored protein